MATDWVPALTIAGSLAGASVVALATYLVQRWRYKIDRLASSIDHFCGELHKAADLATSYWLIEVSTADTRAKVAEIEPRLVGLQLRLQELLIAIREDSKLEIDSVDELMLEFYDALTGGTFKSINRATDPVKAQAVQSISARINGQLRLALARRTDWPCRRIKRLQDAYR